MKKALFIICFGVISVWCCLYIVEANTLYEDIAKVKVIHEPAKHTTTWGGKGLLGEFPEQHIVILQSRQGKRVIRSKKIYDNMKSWHNQTIYISYREHPFRLVSIDLPKGRKAWQ